MQYRKIRKPNQKEIEDLINIEMARRDEFYCYDIETKEVVDGIKHIVKQGLISVFEPNEDSKAEKLMFVIFNYRSYYQLYTWENGIIKSVAQNEEIVETNDKSLEWVVE